VAERAPATACGPVLLTADDFAMTQGISLAIVALAEAGRLSATSAMTTSPHWPSHATWAARIRGHVAVGLHLNLTLGRPLGPMPTFAPDGRFPTIGEVTARAVRGGLDRQEIAAEIERQVAAFEAELGLPPDHVDGHQHVHALPGIRNCLLMVLMRRQMRGRPRPLVRDPADRPARVIARGRGVTKALSLAWLSRGFGAMMRTEGFAVNDGFAGVTAFARARAREDFASALVRPGPRHLVMCHPGHVDDELRRLDPVTDRRAAEHAALLDGAFPAAIWRPDRTPLGPSIDWDAAWPAHPGDDR
jgi:hypothetical protein